MQYRQLQTISGKGSGPAQFREALRGVAVDSHGRILAAGDSEIKLFTADGAISRRWSTAKPAHCVAVSPDGNVYAGETGQIEIFDAAGKLLNTWRDEKLLVRVTAIGFTKDGALAGDAADRAIRHYDRTGKHRNTIGKDNAVNGFLIPNGVVDFAVDPQGIIHAANPGKHCVERYQADGKLVGRIGKFSGTDPAGFTGCCNPTNIALADCIYTAEKAGPRVKAYDHAGNLLAVVATEAFDPNCKNMSIAAAGKRVYVVDTVKLAILVFEREGGKRHERGYDTARPAGQRRAGDGAGGAGRGSLFLVKKASGQIVWQVDVNRCVNSRLGEVTGDGCRLCTSACVEPLSAVRAVNEHSKCGRCNVCPAYFNITSAVDAHGLPSEKLCPRDAIARKPIGKADPEDPANNFYEYVIDEEKCDGCGRCVMKCKEPLGLGSITLRVRYDKCVNCNRCSISTACPKDALMQVPVEQAIRPAMAEHRSA